MEQDKARSPALPAYPERGAVGKKKKVTFFKGPNTFFIFLTRFPRNKSALRDKATKPSATKDECTGAMAQRHRPCIWTRCTRSVLPFTVPLIPLTRHLEVAPALLPRCFFFTASKMQKFTLAKRAQFQRAQEQMFEHRMER